MEIGGQNETITCINKKYFQTIQQSVLAPSLLTGLFLWGFALFWFFIAALTLYQHTSKIKFNLSFWGIIFPIATFTFSTYQLTIITGMVLFKGRPHENRLSADDIKGNFLDRDINKTQRKYKKFQFLRRNKTIPKLKLRIIYIKKLSRRQ